MLASLTHAGQDKAMVSNFMQTLTAYITPLQWACQKHSCALQSACNTRMRIKVTTTKTEFPMECACSFACVAGLEGGT